MAQETILQHWVFSQLILPFFLIFFVVFAVLQKTKVLSENQQLNGLTAFVIGLIFVGAAYQKGIVGNLVLFMTVALIVIFVLYMLIGFAIQGSFVPEKGLKTGFIAVAIVAVVIATMWAVGIQWSFFQNSFEFLFNSSWSGSFWTNAMFVIIIAVGLAVVLGLKGKSA